MPGDGGVGGDERVGEGLRATLKGLARGDREEDWSLGIGRSLSARLEWLLSGEKSEATLVVSNRHSDSECLAVGRDVRETSRQRGQLTSYCEVEGLIDMEGAD